MTDIIIGEDNHLTIREVRMVEYQRTNMPTMRLTLLQAVEALVRMGYRDWAVALESGELIYLPGPGGACLRPMWEA